ncbi:MAG: hypothetical protein QNJ18_18750 [Xenococcaceae cyanobacterium MO_167.B52]|nr:hypothetical protein [Xenococcaceae cyanobacterium MO_167.B52]
MWISLGGLFPVMATYTTVGSVIAGSIKKLFGRLERDEHVIKFPIRFHHYSSGERLRRGDTPLQNGDYVVFTKPTRGLAYRMQDNGLLSLKPNVSTPEEEMARKQLEKVSYISFSVYPELKVSPEFIIGQKLETLLSQLRYGSQNLGNTTFEFLIETITAYKNIKELERYTELFDKQKDKELTKEEKARLEAIAKNSEIAAYLPY